MPDVDHVPMRLVGRDRSCPAGFTMPSALSVRAMRSSPLLWAQSSKILRTIAASASFTTRRTGPLLGWRWFDRANRLGHARLGGWAPP